MTIALPYPQGQAAAPELARLLMLNQLESAARKAQTVKALQFLMVNETRRLFLYRQGFLLSAGHPGRRPYQVEAASSIAVVDRQAPLVRWLEAIVAAAPAQSREPASVQLDPAQYPPELRKEWSEFSMPYVLWAPLVLTDGRVLGGLWLARESAWPDAERALVERLCETYAHAWGALGAGRPRRWRFGSRQRWIAAAITVGALLLPVRLTSLAPVEVIGKDPEVVSAPLNGVIGDIKVLPNTPVKPGQVLFTYEDTSFRNDYVVAEKALEVALAEFRKAAQGSFDDPKSKAEVALLKAKTEQAKAERDYARDVLDKVEVKALSPGLLLYKDKADWIGKPVSVGERIMEVADPNRVELRVYVPVKDAIVTQEGFQVRAFLDVDPIHPLAAKVSHASYKAEVIHNDVLAYQVDADLLESGDKVRIGLQGTAKIYGERVSLYFYLFRRAISAARQYVGF